MGKVTKSLLVCATPRSGSTLLCALLDRTGVAGRPREFFERLAHSGLPRQPREYFERVEDPKLLELLAPTDPGTPDPGDPIPQALAEGTTDNGVFATKLMWTHLLDLAERVGRPADAALLRERFPDPRYVHVTRRDKIAQAVSLWRAVQTRAWRAGEVTENGNAVYHAGAIGYLAGQLTDHDDAWRRWFSANRVEPLTIVYEHLAADTSGVTGEVIDHLGVGPAEIPDPPLRRQGDDRSARWVERYRA
jgi:trehalose 2-sulfotransferase